MEWHRRKRGRGARTSFCKSWDDERLDSDGPSASTMIVETSSVSSSKHPCISSDFNDLMMAISACEKPRSGPIGRGAQYSDVEDYMGQFFVMTLSKFDSLQDLIDLARRESMPIMMERSPSGQDRDWLWVDTKALLQLSTTNSTSIKSDLDEDLVKLQCRKIVFGRINVTLRLVRALLQLSSQPEERISLHAVFEGMQIGGTSSIVRILARKLIELGMSLDLDESTDSLAVLNVKERKRQSSMHTVFRNFFHSHNSVRVAVANLVYDLDRDPEPYLLAFSDNYEQVISVAVQTGIPIKLQEAHLLWTGDRSDVCH